MGIAHGGQIVCSGVVAELAGDHYLLEDLGVHRLRDVESALRVFQVNGAGPGVEVPAARVRSTPTGRTCPAS